MKKLIASAGETLYSPFSNEKKVFVINKGYVFAYTFDDSGKRRIHLIYGPGAYFPVITAFKAREQRASYDALTDVNLDTFTKTDFIKKIKSDPKFALTILKKTVDQLEIFANRVVELQTTRLEDKLYSRLKTLAKEHGAQISEGIELPYVLKHHHLADVLGVERESLSRAWHRLENKGLVKKTAGKIIVL